MLFKNLQLFHFTKPFEYDAETLATRLTEQSFQACGSQQMMSIGWVPPLGKTTELLTHGCQGRIMICARREERILPASVVRDSVEMEAEKVEAEQGRRVFPSERKRLKDEAVMTLLPKAFTRHQLTYAYIDPVLNLLIVDASSRKKAEELTILLRESLGSLPVIPPMVGHAPADVMTRWLKEGGYPEDFALAEQVELKDELDEQSVLRSKGMDVQSEPLIGALEQGMQVKKLAMTYDEHTEFLLEDDLTVKRLKFKDMLRESVDELDKDDVAGRFDADFSIMSSVIANLLPELFEAFGGEQYDS